MGWCLQDGSPRVAIINWEPRGELQLNRSVLDRFKKTKKRGLLCCVTRVEMHLDSATGNGSTKG